MNIYPPISYKVVVKYKYFTLYSNTNVGFDTGLQMLLKLQVNKLKIIKVTRKYA